ncbi:MAG: hypothetical protein IT383_16315 [Deltaproteobacteria bacterium]|nr:hypothetical protein [Deltaproteobacteria bacterium]
MSRRARANARRRRVPAGVLLSLVAVLLCGRCVCGFNSTGVGAACETTAACDANDLLCVHLDESDLGSETICMPDVAFDKVSCTNDDDCQHEGMPVEAFCTGGLCTCEDLITRDAGPPDCPSNTAFGRFACGCVRLAAGAPGSVCEHPEQCASLRCHDGECVERCTEDNDCGGLATSCEADGSCS